MWSKKRRPGKIFIVSGSSGSGKTTLIKRLKRRREFQGNLIKVTTVTTRKPRLNERNGRDYQFVSKEEFLSREKRGEFIESQKIYGDYYATPKKDLRELILSGRDALLCLDVKGGMALKRIFPRNAVLVFIMVSHIKSLKERLRLRSSESKESLEKRLGIVRDEIKCARRYDYIVVNDVLTAAVKKLATVIQAERLKVCI